MRKLGLEKILNAKSLIAINIAIILLAEFVGGGKFFFETGLIHVIAIMFIVLAGIRIFVLHYYTYDPILEKFIHLIVAAFSVFAISHIVEFSSFVIFHLYRDAVFLQVINFYLASLLIIVLGAERLFSIVAHRKMPVVRFAAILGIVFAFAIAIALWFNDSFLNLEIETPTPYVYAVIILLVTLATLARAMQLRTMIPLTKGFATHLIFAIIAIALATLPNIFYDLFQSVGIPEIQVVYLSHFVFYAALSIMFLAFGKLSYLGGVYEDLKRINEKY